MQLSIRDLTGLLQANESTVSRWIRQQGLPAQQVGGQYRVNRAELLEWATANRVRVSLELFDHFDDGDDVPSLACALAAGGVHYAVQARNRQEALAALVRLLPLPDGVDRELLLNLLSSRETSASTAIGDGIAIPHVRNPIVLNVTRPMITLAFLAQPVDFAAPDGKPVGVLFSIVSPTSRGHLQLLSRLAYALHDGQFRQAVSNRASCDEILHEARRIEAGRIGP